jgi:hypothetical protein
MHTLLMMAALGQTPIDPAELAKAQSALESYYSRIKTLQIVYTEKAVGSNSEEESRHHDLLFAFPSIRRTTVESLLVDLGTPQERLSDVKTTTSIHQGQLIGIDYHYKSYTIESSANPLFHAWLPLDTLGWRIPGTLNTPLSDLLKFPEIISFDGEETIDGYRCLRLTLGPHIPAQARPRNWSDNAVVKVSLAPDHNYLPVRWETRHTSDKRPELGYRMSLGSFQEVPDLARGAKVTFPHRLKVLFSNEASIAYHVESAAISGSVKASDFAPPPPSGFTVIKDGKVLTISGGTPAGDRRIKQSADEAKRLFGSLNPPRDTRWSWTAWAVAAIAGASILVLVIAGFLKWRAR